MFNIKTKNGFTFINIHLSIHPSIHPSEYQDMIIRIRNHIMKHASDISGHTILLC